MSTTKVNTLPVPGADLDYQIRGSGPVLLIIQGGRGEAGLLDALLDHLLDQYTVVTYDRRACAAADEPAESPNLETHGNDIHHLLAALTTEPVLVLGVGVGAIIGLNLVARHPEQVRALVAHEPPALQLLPDGERGQTEHALEDDAEIYRHQLDIPALQAAPIRILSVGGRDSRHDVPYRCADVLADRLGTRLVEFPGGHVGFLTHPSEFAAQLCEILSGSGRAYGPPDSGRIRKLEDLAADHASVPPRRSGRPRAAFYDARYGDAPPWDIGRPQSAFLALAEAGVIRGRVLDVGCGTGEHVLMAAGLRLDATGLDYAEEAVIIAEGKARDRGLTARFLVRDVFQLASLEEQFDTVLDCGFFHLFSNDDRPALVDNLRAVVPPGGRYFMLCFSDRQTGKADRHVVTQGEIRASFSEGWQVDSIEPAQMDMAVPPNNAPAWLASITRI